MAPKSLVSTLKPKRITQAILGKHLDLSERSVRELFGKDIFPNTVNSKALTEADIDICRIAYIQHLRVQAAGRSKDNDEVSPRTTILTFSWLGSVKNKSSSRGSKRRKIMGELVERVDLRLAVSAAFSRVKTVLPKGLQETCGTSLGDG